MNQLVLSQYVHRVEYVLSRKAFYDGCYRTFKNGKMAFRGLECSRFVYSDSDERTVRLLFLTTSLQLQSGRSQLTMSQTQPYSGYDLCMECALKSSFHINDSEYD